MGPCAEVDYNLTLCPLQSLPQHVYQWQPYARTDLNPYARVDFIPQSVTLNLAYGIIAEAITGYLRLYEYILYSNYKCTGIGQRYLM
jgi:hypothetical protein